MCVWGEGVAAEVPGQVPAGAALPRGGVCVGEGGSASPPGVSGSGWAWRLGCGGWSLRRGRVRARVCLGPVARPAGKPPRLGGGT